MMTNQIFRLENYDPDLEPEQLVGNITSLADYMSNRKSKSRIEDIKIVTSFLLKSEKLMATNRIATQLQLCKSLIYAFIATSPDLPFDNTCFPFLYRIFRLFSKLIASLSKGRELEHIQEIIKLLKLFNKYEIFSVAKDQSSIIEMFDSLITINNSDAVEILVKKLNNLDLIPLKLFHLIFDLISNDNSLVKIVLSNISHQKQLNIVQNIRSNVSGVNVYRIFEKMTKICNFSVNEIFSFVEFDIKNENEKIRMAAVTVLIKIFNEIEFSIEHWSKYEMIFDRSNDVNCKVRSRIVIFAFDTLQKMKKIPEEREEKSFLESCMTQMEGKIWEIAKNRITDKSNEVRLTVLTKIDELEIEEIKIDLKLLSLRLRDKSPDIRIKCLEIMMRLVETNPNNFVWLLLDLIQLFHTVKEISLFGFSVMIKKFSLIEIAEQIEEIEPLLSILKETNEFRELLPNYKNKEIQQKLSKFMDIKILMKAMKNVTKNFLTKALEWKNRLNIYKNLKAKMDQKNLILLLGFYQPIPIQMEEILHCENLEIVKKMAKIYARHLVLEIPELLSNLQPANLIILSSLQHHIIDIEQRTMILNGLISELSHNLLDKTNLLRTIACFLTENDSYILETINNYEFESFEQKLAFYSKCRDFNAIPFKIIDEIINYIFHNKCDFQTSKNFVENSLKIFTKIIYSENLKYLQNISKDFLLNIQQQFIKIAPTEIFKAFLVCSPKIYSFTTPQIFRCFGYLIQHKKSEVRRTIIQYLSDSLQQSETPIQFISYFALSATDPNEQNKNKAKEALESAIELRRSILGQIHLLKKTENNKQSYSNITPETASPYLINILAHHSDFDNDLPELATFSIYLHFFLIPLCSNQSNYPAVLDILFHLQFLDDIEDQYTNKMVKLCELASAILQKIGSGREWNLNSYDKFEYSTRYFKETPNKNRIKEILKQNNNGKEIKIPEKPRNPLRAGMKTPTRTRIYADTENEIPFHNRIRNTKNHFDFEYIDNEFQESSSPFFDNQIHPERFSKRSLSPTLIGSVIQTNKK
ncbi:hypothetical protein TRFO_34264 [Tritrichomonas foetus]|uniref:Condensin complex subunit 1 C-terminal domain-containing protein n=1 Tax=Tritrichomonas foetus TaxID=1144522 RepID=A0A1J4JP83_9EUKA|nr:hypothetical protein TRFO_34264 [Tritrichomonas foetus]|eukprot:OHS99323.1 hypothetical protein TRFO_34264 [Tritrichomonas foetus]